MKHFLVASLTLLSLCAQAQEAAQTQTQTSSSNSQAAATNQGNSQSITFTSPAVSTSNVNQTVSGTTTQNVNSTVSGSTTQNVNQNVSGTTTQNQNVNQTVSGTTTQNVNQALSGGTTNSNTNVNVNTSEERQIVSGGTNSTIHQTFGEQKIKNTPSVNGPPLVSSNDTCMGSASGSLNVPGVGIGIGSTYTDNNCVMLKNSRELWNMGMRAAAMALMCTDAANREALELTGFVCPQTARDQKAKASTVAVNEPTDPIVRRRLGLPPL